MSKVEIIFRITQIGHTAEQEVEETLELLPHATKSRILVENKDSGITGEGENLTSAVLNYLYNRASAPPR